MALVAVVCWVGLLVGAGSALAETKTFKPEGGSEQAFEVPAGVTQIEVTTSAHHAADVSSRQISGARGGRNG
jgi:hypothetical protein